MKSYISRYISLRKKKYVRYYYYSALGAIGLKKSPSLYQIDKKIEPYLLPGRKRGFFVEAGGNDGVSQSNTFHLEKYYGWSGFIVEPVPWLNKIAQNFRTCGIETSALGRFSDRGLTLRLAENDLTTRAVSEEIDLVASIEVQIEPLSDILDRRKVNIVDFFSLDVEGYENAVLGGIDFDRHIIKALLVETKNISSLEIDWRRYRDPISITHHDYLILSKT
ncbi:hypothetical protein LSUCC0031_00180 [Rhodobacterales bacterium LSUCC0031]|nr:hypothetical protein [Rhodobacterales bacterium LSUCC0031]